jgi:mycarose O-acyltransferase
VLAHLLPSAEQFPIVALTPWQLWFIYQLPPVRLLDFIIGILLARIVLSGRMLPISYRGAQAIALVALVVVPLWVPADFAVVALPTVPIGLFIAAGAVADDAGQRTLLGRRVAVWLGEVSFAFYLWHKLVIDYGHYWLGLDRMWTPAATVVIGVVAFGISLFLSWLLFTLVETPLVRLAAGRRPKALAVVQDAVVQDSVQSDDRTAIQKMPADPPAA